MPAAISCDDRAARRERRAHRIGRRAEIDRQIELPQHRAEPLGQISPRRGRAGTSPGPSAARARWRAAQQRAIEDLRACGMFVAHAR